MTAWTYHLASEHQKYYLGLGGTPIIWVELLTDQTPGFRKVSNGRYTTDGISVPNYDFKQKLLPREWWPKWLEELDDYGVDEGL